MYMTMIGMAIVAVPRGIYRALVWLVMGVAGWCMALVETVFADTSYTFSSNELVVTSDGDNDTVSIYATNDSVFVYDFIDSPSLVTTDASEVHNLMVDAGGGNDSILATDVTAANGFDNLIFLDLHGGNGNDLISGSNGLEDEIFGEGGDDTLLGHAGEDIIAGGDGADSILGGADDDILFHNILDFGAGGAAPDGDADTLDGGAGNNDFAKVGTGDGDNTIAVP